MQIKNLRRESIEGKMRVAATVIWEDCDRAPQEVFYATHGDFAQDLTCDPHAFLTACVLPALQLGERRVAIDAAICPDLRTGLLTAMGWFAKWYHLPRNAIQIEAKPEIRYPSPSVERAGSFLSGGVDSLALLRVNRLEFPRDHPRSIKDCFFIHGFDIGAFGDGNPEADFFELALATLSPVAQDAGIALMPVYTNVRHLADAVPFWIYEFHGAALASVAHAFSRRLTCVSIASGFSIRNMSYGATHPLIDSNYGGANLQIRHEGILLSRLDKVRLIADWAAALDSLRVCTMNAPNMLNCGKCEKCVRTMTQLLAINKLGAAATFPSHDVSSAMLENVTITEKYQDAWYEELIAPLTEQGRHDLVAVIHKKRQEFKAHLAWVEERDWKGALKRFDRQYLGESLRKIYRGARNRMRANDQV